MSQGEPSPFQNITGAATNAYSSAADSISNLKNSVSSSMGDYSSSSSLGEASNEFLQSNSIIAKVAFILFVIILFNILLRLGMFLLSYFSKTNENPYLIQGLIYGNKSILVRQDPRHSKAVPLLRSNNKSSGIEFTWSVWLFINSVGTNQNITTDNTKVQHIFSKGDNSYGGDGIALLNNGPGVYLSRNTDPTIRIKMDTVVATAPAIIDINNIPLKKWFHLLLRVQNTSLDVYVNGVISAHVILDNVPKQNYYDVFVCDNGGFDGSLSDLRYYASALDIFSISAIVSRGPNLKPSTSPAVGDSDASSSGTKGYSYLSTSWYTSRV
jgi:hypothetical protein